MMAILSFYRYWKIALSRATLGWGWSVPYLACKFPCMWLIRAFRGAAYDSVWEKGAKLHTFAFRALSEWIGSAYQAKLSWRGWAGSLSAPAFYLDVGARQVPGKYRLASNSILAGILLSRGWSPGANYSLLCCPEGHLVRSIVLREGKRGWQATSRRLIDFKKRDTEPDRKSVV